MYTRLLSTTAENNTRNGFADHAVAQNGTICAASYVRRKYPRKYTCIWHKVEQYNLCTMQNAFFSQLISLQERRRRAVVSGE